VTPAGRLEARHWRCTIGSALVLLLIVVSSPSGLHGQEWRARALAVFDEVWQTVADTHYDPTFGGVDWPAVRRELRPRAEQAASADGVRQVVTEMLARLGQSHFALLTSSPVGQPLAGDAMPPVDIRVHDDGVVVTAVEAGLGGDNAQPQPGDLIVGLDGADVSLWFGEAEGRDLRARRLAVWQRAFRALHGSDGEAVRLLLRGQDGRDRAVTVPRRRKPGQAVMLGNLPPIYARLEVSAARTPGERKVGLIAFNAWMAAVAEPFARAVDEYRHADGVILDLRGNVGGLAEMLRGVSGHFLSTPDLLGRMRMRDATLEFRANPRRSTSDGRAVEPFAGPLAILVDELTASASECFAGAMQSLGRARVFGRQTMGQALPASTRALSNGDVLMYAVGDFVTSNGRALEGVGVVPDEAVPLSRRLLADGRDPVVEAALAWIDRTSAAR
jgi:carboxyl-terminal processing protease